MEQSEIDKMHLLMAKAEEERRQSLALSLESKEKELPPIEPENKKAEIKKVAEKAIVAGAIASLQDEDFQTKVKDQARQALGTEINTQQNILDREEQESFYDANKEACDAFGIDKGVPTWQIKMMRVGHAVWFIVYYVVAFLTVAPITIFTKMFSHFIKRNWIALIIAVVIWALIITSPIIGIWISKAIASAKEAASVAPPLPPTVL